MDDQTNLIDLFDAAFPKEIDQSFGYWLAGFVDGEGCFFIAQTGQRVNRKNGNVYKCWPNCRFQITLRADDAEILRTIRDTLGFGNLTSFHSAINTRPNVKPSCSYTTNRIDDCLRLVEFFTRYPLRAKKRAQFDVWANAVHEMAKGRDRDGSFVEQCRVSLAELRQYVAPDWLDRVREGNPPALKHRRDYGTPPPCLCGCGGATKILSNPAGITHPENPNYSCFMRGHYTRRVLARIAADL